MQVASGSSFILQYPVGMAAEGADGARSGEAVPDSAPPQYTPRYTQGESTEATQGGHLPIDHSAAVTVAVDAWVQVVSTRVPHIGMRT